MNSNQKGQAKVFLILAAAGILVMLAFNMDWERLEIKFIAILIFSVLMLFGMLVRSDEHGDKEP